MANKPRQAKVSVRTEDGKNDLVTINKDDSLQETIKALRNYFCLVSVSYKNSLFNPPKALRSQHLQSQIDDDKRWENDR